MNKNKPVRIHTKFNNRKEAIAELEKLSKLKIMAVSGSTKRQKIIISIDKSDFIEVRTYDLIDLSKNTYFEFNKSVKKLD